MRNWYCNYRGLLLWIKGKVWVYLIILFLQIKLILTNKTKKNQEEIKSNRFNYMITGLYKGGSVPEGMILFTFPKLEWAKFKCLGPLPTALQDLNTKIFRAKASRRARAVLRVSFFVGWTERIATIPAETAKSSLRAWAQRIASTAATVIFTVFVMMDFMRKV